MMIRTGDRLINADRVTNLWRTAAGEVYLCWGAASGADSGYWHYVPGPEAEAVWTFFIADAIHIMPRRQHPQPQALDMYRCSCSPSPIAYRALLQDPAHVNQCPRCFRDGCMPAE